MMGHQPIINGGKSGLLFHQKCVSLHNEGLKGRNSIKVKKKELVIQNEVQKGQCINI